MQDTNSIPWKHKALFWMILAAFSTFFAEVFSGADMFPFFHAWGLLVVVPLYGLHILVLAHLVYRAPQPRFPSLIFAGMLFGLYEAYLTKVLWNPPWGEALIIGGVAPIETLVLVLWWHAWFSFIIPLLIAEKLLTRSRVLGRSLPAAVGRLLNSRWGLVGLVAFGGVFQSVNSPSVDQSLLSGLSTTAVLIGLVLVWRRVTRDRTYTMHELLPDKKEFRLLLIPTALLYLIMGVVMRPEAVPGLVGQGLIWLLYALSFFLLWQSLKPGSKPQNGPRTPVSEKFPDRFWLVLAGVFPLAAVSGELLLAPVAEPLALASWFGGILFSLIMFARAVRLTIQKPSPSKKETYA